MNSYIEIYTLLRNNFLRDNMWRNSSVSAVTQGLRQKQLSATCLSLHFYNESINILSVHH